MPSSATTSAPLRVLRSSEILALYFSSSTPDGWNFTVAVTPLAFIALVNVGIT
jgi:hypothetical protein